MQRTRSAAAATTAIVLATTWGAIFGGGAASDHAERPTAGVHTTSRKHLAPPWGGASASGLDFATELELAHLELERQAAEQARLEAEAKAAAEAAAAEQARQEAARATTRAPVTSQRSYAGDPAANRALGQQMAAAYGWTGQEWDCLDTLWGVRESGWRTDAGNAEGAWGIPQAVPGSKMSSAGADWQTSAATQITWGLGYIAGRYGTPCAALAHSYSRGWY